MWTTITIYRFFLLIDSREEQASAVIPRGWGGTKNTSAALRNLEPNSRYANYRIHGNRSNKSAFMEMYPYRLNYKSDIFGGFAWGSEIGNWVGTQATCKFLCTRQFSNIKRCKIKMWDCNLKSNTILKILTLIQTVFCYFWWCSKKNSKHFLFKNHWIKIFWFNCTLLYQKTISYWNNFY